MPFSSKIAEMPVSKHHKRRAVRTKVFYEMSKTTRATKQASSFIAAVRSARADQASHASRHQQSALKFFDPCGSDLNELKVKFERG